MLTRRQADKMSDSQKKIAKLANVVDNMNSKLSSISSDLADIKSNQSAYEADMKNLKEIHIAQGKSITDLKLENEDLRKEIQDLKRKSREKDEKLENIENYMRIKNLKFSGIRMVEHEDCEKAIRTLMSEKLGITNAFAMPIAACHRLPYENNDIIVQFESRNDRENVWKQRKYLKNTKIVLKEHFCKETENARRILFPYMKEAQSQGKRAFLIGNKLKIDGKLYSTDSLPPFTPLCTKENDTHVYFYGRHSVFSNFFPVKFLVNGKSYNCVEQFYQSEYAKFHDNRPVYEEIMREQDPSKQLRCAKKIKPKSQWQQCAVQIMKNGIEAKFQTQELKDVLLATGSKDLVECNRNDSFFGIGLSLNNPNISDPGQWKGLNHLGSILGEVREGLEVE